MAREPVLVVNIRAVNADVDRQAEKLSEHDRDDADRERILRLDEADPALAEDGAADAQHPPKAVQRAGRIGGNRLDVRREAARLQAVAFVGIRHDDVFVEMPGVAHHPLNILRAFAIPKAARVAEREDGETFHRASS